MGAHCASLGWWRRRGWTRAFCEKLEWRMPMLPMRCHLVRMDRYPVQAAVGTGYIKAAFLIISIFFYLSLWGAAALGLFGGDGMAGFSPGNTSVSRCLQQWPSGHCYGRRIRSIGLGLIPFWLGGSGFSEQSSRDGGDGAIRVTHVPAARRSHRRSRRYPESLCRQAWQGLRASNTPW
jgi:hypothetical protein